jgi:hypothetical protein
MSHSLIHFLCYVSNASISNGDDKTALSIDSIRFHSLIWSSPPCLSFRGDIVMIIIMMMEKQQVL